MIIGVELLSALWVFIIGNDTGRLERKIPELPNKDARGLTVVSVSKPFRNNENSR